VRADPLPRAGCSSSTTAPRRRCRAFADPDVYSSDDGTLSQVVSGQIVVDASRVSEQGAGDPEGLEPTMLHEIGHLVGLGPGDLAGLNYLGTAAGCVEDPALPRDSSDYPG
jgi:hypothetical protein